MLRKHILDTVMSKESEEQMFQGGKRYLSLFFEAETHLGDLLRWMKRNNCLSTNASQALILNLLSLILHFPNS